MDGTVKRTTERLLQARTMGLEEISKAKFNNDFLALWYQCNSWIGSQYPVINWHD